MNSSWSNNLTCGAENGRFVTEDEIFHSSTKNDGFRCFRKKKRQPVKKCQIGASGLCALRCARVRPAAGADHFALVIFNRPGQGLVCTWRGLRIAGVLQLTAVNGAAWITAGARHELW